MNVNIGTLLILVMAILCDLLVPVIIGGRYPGYNHYINTISALGSKKSPVKKIECSNLIVIGILLIVFSLLEHISFKQSSWSTSMYSLGIILFGVGCIFAGIFPADSEGVNETYSGKIHGIASGIGFMFLLLNPLWAIWIDAFSTYKNLNGILFIVGLITFFLFVASERKNKGIMQYTGLFQRFNLLALYGCLLINYSLRVL